MKSLGIYIHIPFCKRKCHYCDFVSYTNMESVFDKYIDAVISEAYLYADYLKNRVVDTVFIGGGTPSLLSVPKMQRLVNGIKSACNWKPHEITAEANPETLDTLKIKGYAECGINRLSLGLQTHNDDILRNIGRRHTYGMFTEAVTDAKKFFKNISADVIFGLPGQTQGDFKTTIQKLIDIKIPHISAYALKLEPGTKLAGEYGGADEAIDRQMYHSAVEMLGKAGYSHYETSNFAKKGFECRHNLKYWTDGEYLGLGVAAHSYIEDTGKIRFSNIKTIDGYLKRINSGEKPTAQSEILSVSDEKSEYIMLRLRLKWGIVFSDYDIRFSGDFKKEFEQPIEYTKKAGLISEDEAGIYPTLKGFDLQNTLITEFMKKL